MLRLTIDGRLQASLEALAPSARRRPGRELSAAILVIDNDTGEVMAHVGSAGYLARERGAGPST